MNTAAFALQNIISHVSRERCMTNLRNFRLPSNNKRGKQPTATAAVLVPLCYVNDQTSILYTLRASSLRSDSGLISFPGGKTDGSETALETALRETKEEIGLLPDIIDIWGCGQTVHGRNHKMLITPVFGCIENLSKNDFRVNKNEVSEVFAVPLELLSNPKNQFYTQFQNGYIMPVFIAGEYKIWGLTAFLTHMLLSCLLSKDVYKNEWMTKKLAIKSDNQNSDVITRGSL